MWPLSLCWDGCTWPFSFLREFLMCSWFSAVHFASSAQTVMSSKCASSSNLPLNPFTILKSVVRTVFIHSAMSYFHLIAFRIQCVLDLEIPVSLADLHLTDFFSEHVKCCNTTAEMASFVHRLPDCCWATSFTVLYTSNLSQILVIISMLEVCFQMHGCSCLHFQYHFKINWHCSEFEPLPLCVAANHEKWYFGAICYM